MKLSEAILLGSIGSIQGFGLDSIATESKERCVMGAALFARGVKATGLNGMAMVSYTWPWVNKEVELPLELLNFEYRRIDKYYRLNPDASVPIYSILWRLNDTLKWTRPRIAAWVAKQEALYDTIPTTQEATRAQVA